jgi:hypothetical protein
VLDGHKWFTSNGSIADFASSWRARLSRRSWASFLAAAMRADAIPEADPRLLTRAVLGLYTSRDDRASDASAELA